MKLSEEQRQELLAQAIAMPVFKVMQSYVPAACYVSKKSSLLVSVNL